MSDDTDFIDVRVMLPPEYCMLDVRMPDREYIAFPCGPNDRAPKKLVTLSDSQVLYAPIAMVFRRTEQRQSDRVVYVFDHWAYPADSELFA